MTSFTEKTILLVEKEVSNALNEQTTLEKFDFKVISCIGKEADAILNSNSEISLILLALDLGKKTDSVKLAKQILQKHDLPIIFLSSDTESKIVKKTESITSYGFIPKDSAETVLITNIKIALRLFEARMMEQEKVKTLRLNESQSRALIEAIPDLMFRMDKEGVYLDYKASIEDLIYQKESLIGKKIRDVAPKDFASLVEHKIKLTLHKGKMQEFDYEVPIPGRGIRYYNARLVPANSNEIIAIIRDITERKQTEEKNLQALSLLNATLESTADGILVIDTQGKVISFNRKFLNLWHIPESITRTKEDKVLLSYILDQLKDPDAFLEKVEWLYAHPENSSEDVIEFKDGRIFERYSQPQKLEDKIVGRVWSFRDITEKIKSRIKQETLYKISKSLSETTNITELCNKIREHLSEVIDTTNFYVALYDEINDVISLPYNVDEKDDYETFPAGKTLTKYVIETAQPLLATNDIVDKLTEEGLVEEIGSPSESWLGVPLKIKDRVIGVIALQSYDNPNLYSEEDIKLLNFVSEEIAVALKHKQSEAALEESEDKFRSLINQAAEMLFLHDLQGNIIDVNQATIENTGYSKKELVGMNVIDIDPDVQNRDDMNQFWKAIEPENPAITFEARHRRKNGEIYPAEITISKIILSDGHYILGLAHNIAERKKAEEEIKTLLKEKELLLKETHHRIKNNMGVIKSLLSLQASSQNNLETARILRDACSRVQSMVVLYDKLYRSEAYHELNLKEFLPPLVDEIISLFHTNLDIKVNSQIDNIVLNSKLCSSVGIILNEFITNSMKHAFKEKNSGSIYLTAQKSNSLLKITYSDDGVGLPESVNLENSTGFGMQLIKMLVKQINASIEVLNDHGAKFVLEIKT